MGIYQRTKEDYQKVIKEQGLACQRLSDIVRDKMKEIKELRRKNIVLENKIKRLEKNDTREKVKYNWKSLVKIAFS